MSIGTNEGFFFVRLFGWEEHVRLEHLEHGVSSTTIVLNLRCFTNILDQGRMILGTCGRSIPVEYHATLGSSLTGPTLRKMGHLYVAFPQVIFNA